jgi:hypothetical protein
MSPVLLLATKICVLAVLVGFFSGEWRDTLLLVLLFLTVVVLLLTRCISRYDTCDMGSPSQAEGPLPEWAQAALALLPTIPAAQHTRVVRRRQLLGPAEVCTHSRLLSSVAGAICKAESMACAAEDHTVPMILTPQERLPRVNFGAWIQVDELERAAKELAPSCGRAVRDCEDVLQPGMEQGAWETAYLSTGGACHREVTLMAVLQRLLSAAHEVDAEQGWNLLQPRPAAGSVQWRNVEYHVVRPGGSLSDPQVYI